MAASAAGYWAFELVDAWVDLYDHDGDPRWLNDAARAIEFIKNQLEDNNGHYGIDWNGINSGDLGKGWPVLSESDLINQAAVASAFLHTGLAETPGLEGDFNRDGLLNRADWAILIANSYDDLSVLPFKERYLHGDLDRNGRNDFADFRAFKELYVSAHGVEAFRCCWPCRSLRRRVSWGWAPVHSSRATAVRRKYESETHATESS